MVSPTQSISSTRGRQHSQDSGQLLGLSMDTSYTLPPVAIAQRVLRGPLIVFVIVDTHSVPELPGQAPEDKPGLQKT